MNQSMKSSLKCVLKQVVKSPTLLAMNFNVKSYIESVAYNKANEAYKRHGQKRADFVYNTYMRVGWKLWDDLTHDLPWYEAEIWMRKQFGNEDLNNPSETNCVPVAKPCLKPGPQMWVNSVKDDYKVILKKLNDFLHGLKSEKNKGIIVKSMVDMCHTFVAVEPGFYDEERHGKFLSKSEFDYMINQCKNIISQFG